MPSVVADTHAVIWYLSDSPRLSRRAHRALETALGGGLGIHVSSITLVETIYLVEKRRLPSDALQRLENALAHPDRGLIEVPVDSLVADALKTIPRELVPDMPDRIIAATALHLNLPLVTRDRRLQDSPVRTIW